MSGCLVADDAAVIQVTRVISIQSQARGVIEMTTTERRRNKKHHNSGVAIILKNMIISICTLTLLQNEPVGGGGVLLLFACCYMSRQLHACKSMYMYRTTCPPEHHDIILGAVCQAVCRPAAYDTLPGMRGDPLLNKCTQVVQRLAHVVDQYVVCLL